METHPERTSTWARSGGSSLRVHCDNSEAPVHPLSGTNESYPKAARQFPSRAAGPCQPSGRTSRPASTCYPLSGPRSWNHGLAVGPLDGPHGMSPWGLQLPCRPHVRGRGSESTCRNRARGPHQSTSGPGVPCSEALPALGISGTRRDLRKFQGACSWNLGTYGIWSGPGIPCLDTTPSPSLSQVPKGVSENFKKSSAKRGPLRCRARAGICLPRPKGGTSKENAE